MGEKEEHAEMVEKAAAWYRALFDYAIREERLPDDGPVREAIMYTRQRAMSFCAFQAEFLPAGVIYKRLHMHDEMMTRSAFNAMDKENRDSLMTEAKASVKKHGGTLKAHKSRLIHELFGIPRF